MATMQLPRNVVAVRIENVRPIRGIAQTITRTLNSMGAPPGLTFSVCATRELRKQNRARHVGRATHCRKGYMLFGPNGPEHEAHPRRAGADGYAPTATTPADVR
jgi:hypothetical protein